MMFLIEDGFKEVFFRNFLGVLQDRKVYGSLFTIQFMMTNRYCDNYEVYINSSISWYLTHAIYSAASCMGWMMGLRPWYEEYTPERIRYVAGHPTCVSLKKA